MSYDPDTVNAAALAETMTTANLIELERLWRTEDLSWAKVQEVIRGGLMLIERAEKAEAAASIPQPAEIAPQDGRRLILFWDDSSALPVHFELGRHRDGAWRNTYGHPFASDPTHWLEPHMPSAALSPANPTMEQSSIVRTQQEAAAIGPAIEHPGCSYLGYVGMVCNKCGQLVQQEAPHLGQGEN